MAEPDQCYQCLSPPKDTTLLRCGQCKSRRYCSKHCQKQDWIYGGHKRSCDSKSSTSSQSVSTIPGVRLPCKSEDSGSLTAVEIPSNHIIFQSHVLPVPSLLEIPLVIHRVGTHSEDEADLDCQIATYLNIHPVSGFAPEQWLSRVGTCVVARKDGKPLKVEQLDMVWTFIDEVLDKYGGEGPERARQEWNKKAFQLFEKEYVKKKALEGLGSVYDV